jgi:hypothetical protein
MEAVMTHQTVCARNRLRASFQGDHIAARMDRRVRFKALILPILTATLVHSACEREVFSPKNPPQIFSDLAQTDGPLSADDIGERFARRHPGYAGFRLSEDRSYLEVFVAGSHRAAGVLAAIDSILIDHRLTPQRSLIGLRKVIRLVKYDLAQLQPWRKLARSYFDQFGITRLSIDESRGVLRVGLSSSAQTDNLRSTLVTRGVPEDALDIYQATLIEPLIGTLDTINSGAYETYRGGYLIQGL